MPRGGARPGAGRPKGSTIPDKRQPVTVRLPPDLIEWLAKFGNKRGRLIEKALRHYRDTTSEG